MPLLIYNPGNGTHHTVAITAKPVIVGRVLDSDVVVKDTFVSRLHCEIAYVEGEYILKDLGSTNGTYRNGRKVYQCKLGSGDRIQLGNTTLLFEINNKTGDATLSQKSDSSQSPHTKKAIQGLNTIRGRVKPKKPVIVKLPAQSQLTKSS